MKRRSLLLSALALATFVTASLRVVGAAEPAPAVTIARIWRGRTLASKADEYERYLISSGISKIRATLGNRGVKVLRRTEGDRTEFLVMSLWDSIDSIKRFAGDDYQKAVILPRDREYLLEVEPNVLHYEVKLEMP